MFTASVEIKNQNLHAKNTVLSSCHNTLLLNNTVATKYGGPLLRGVHKIISDIQKRIPEDISVDLLYLIIFSNCSRFLLLNTFARTTSSECLLLLLLQGSHTLEALALS